LGAGTLRKINDFNRWPIMARPDFRPEWLCDFPPRGNVLRLPVLAATQVWLNPAC
jgi:hypothetical protein